MDKPLVTITYKLANGSKISVEVLPSVKELLEQSDRQIRSQRRQDRRYLDFTVRTDDALASPLLPVQEDIADLVIRSDSYRQLYAAMEKLSEVHKRRMYLYHFCGLTCREIAHIESVDQSTVSRSLRKALEAMKDFLTE